MQNPLLNDEQYRAAQYSTAFQPVDIIDLVPEIEKEQNRQEDAFKKRVQSMKENDNRAIENAKIPNSLQELGAFSKTLTESLVEVQDKKNKADMQRGMMQAMTDGISPEEEAEFEADEAALKEGKVAADKAAEQVQEETGNVFVADRVRGMSSWERYGYMKGQVMNAATNYPVYLAEAKANASIVIDGKTVTFDNAETPEELAALQAQVTSEYLEQFNGANPAMLNKYLFPTIRQHNANEAVKFATEQAAEREKQLQSDRKDDLYLEIKSDNPDAITDFILNHPKGAGAGKRELLAILQAGLKDGSISGEYVLQAIFEQEITFNDGSVDSIAGKNPGIFDGLRQLAEDAIRGRVDRDSDLIATRQQDTENRILEAMDASDGIYTPEEMKVIVDQWKQAHPGVPLPDIIKDRFTANMDIDEDQARIRIDSILDERGYLVEDDFKGMPKSLQLAYENYIRSPGNEAPPQRLQTEANQAITAQVDVLLEEKDANKEKSPTYRRIERRAKADFLLLYNEGLNEGLSEAQAAERAIQLVNQRIEAHALNQEGVLTGLYNTAGDTGDSRDEQLIRQRRDTYLESIRRNPASIDTYTYLSQDELEQGLQFLNGDGTAPEIATMLASQLSIPTYDLIAAQLQAAGMDVPGKRPEVEGEVDGLDPGIQRLLRHQASPSRTTRAVQESQATGDAKFFLDSVAGYESAAHGEYDAMNTGGSGIGPSNTAYGSSNSCDVTGCLSQMTLGDVIELQRQGKVFAAGRYQFIPSTLIETARSMNLSMDTPFDATTQDALALARLNWRLSAQNSLTGLRTEWQGLWHMPDAEAQRLLQAARGLVSVYNQPQNILPALRSA